MLNANRRYNRELTKIILDVGKKFYTPALDQKTVDRFLEAINIKAGFESLLENPSGEFQGTIAPLEVQSKVGKELEQIILSMVENIIADNADFPIKKWKMNWAKSLGK